MTRSLAEERVDERGLADVRAPDHGEADDALVLVGLVALGEQLDHAVEQVAGPEALGGRDRHRLAEAEAVEVVDEREVARRVDLVRHQHDRQAALAQHVGDLGVAGAVAGAGVDHQHRDVGVGERLAHLVADRDRQRIGVLEVDAAGVDQREAAAVPVGGELLAVAVIPDRSWTTASRDWVSRLTSEDLPTFG